MAGPREDDAGIILTVETSENGTEHTADSVFGPSLRLASMTWRSSSAGRNPTLKDERATMARQRPVTAAVMMLLPFFGG
jgi:hypothetical protein